MFTYIVRRLFRLDSGVDRHQYRRLYYHSNLPGDYGNVYKRLLISQGEFLKMTP